MVKVAVNAYAVIKDDLFIEMKTKFPAGLNFITMQDRMARVRNDFDLILSIYIVIKSLISFIETNNRIPVKFIKHTVSWRLPFVDYENGLGPLPDKRIDFEHILHGWISRF